MILLDKPLVSGFVKQSIREDLFDALDTGGVLQPGELGLLHEDEAVRRLNVDDGERIHTISENSISWIEQNLNNTYLKEKIRLFKDKFTFREMTADLYPDFHFMKVSVNELEGLNLSADKYPFIIKPNIGFFSMGVHKVINETDWNTIRTKMRKELSQIQNVYPAAVLDTADFIIEEVIEGDEYAIDAYFDESGNAVLVGVMHHLFGSETDVSDRVYLTSAEIVNRHKRLFLEFLADIGLRAGLKDFSLHVEVRIDKDGKLAPIEVNPLRFGAWCTSADLMHYAFGFNSYYYYLKNIRPDWDQITDSINDDIYSIIILDNSTGIPAHKIKSFDYDAVSKNFKEILELRKVDYHTYPIFGILFTRFKPEDFGEIEKILQENLKKYLKF